MLPSCFRLTEEAQDALTRVLQGRSVDDATTLVRLVEAALVRFERNPEGGYTPTLTQDGIEALTRVGAFDICAECGEERHALIHTDTELHPADAEDGLYLHSFGG